jgi:hypothetical protein
MIVEKSLYNGMCFWGFLDGKNSIKNLIYEIWFNGFLLLDYK